MGFERRGGKVWKSDGFFFLYLYFGWKVVLWRRGGVEGRFRFFFLYGVY